MRAWLLAAALLVTVAVAAAVARGAAVAGGFGEGGTAVVFEQTWYSLGGGELRCLQTVPYATSCILADPE